MSDHHHIVVEVLLFLVFQTLRKIFLVIQNIKWHLDGTRKTITETKREGRYELSAHVLNIQMKRNMDPIAIQNDSIHFILTHHGFVDPEYVLKKEVSLYYIDDNEAVFVEAPPGVEVWRSRHGAWHRLAQHKYAEKIVKMPLHSFYKLVEDIEDPDEKLIILQFIPRTGSTLLCQMFEETEKVVAYSEPQVLLHVFDHMSDVKHMPQASKERYLKSVVRYLCRPNLLQGTTEAYMVKVPQCFIEINKPLFHQCFPKARFMFQYRNVDKTINSMERTIPNMIYATVFYFFLFWCAWIWRRMVIFACTHYMNNPDDQGLVDILMRTKNPEKLRYYVYYCSMMASHLRWNGTPAIKYEDLINNPQKCIQTIFDHCGLDRNLVTKAMKALGRDSQANTVVSRDRVVNAQTPVDKNKVPPEVYMDIEELFQHFKVQGPDGDIRIPYTITEP